MPKRAKRYATGHAATILKHIVTINALHAFVPELRPQAHTWSDSSPPVLAARQIVVHSTFLRDLIDDYRHQLAIREASFGPPCDDDCF